MLILVIAAIALVVLTAVDAKLGTPSRGTYEGGNARRRPPQRVTPRRRSQVAPHTRPSVAISAARSATSAARWWWE
jgi:hypothetical protein